MEVQSEHISSTRKYFRFENIALVLGFIVDSITITTILLSLSLPDTKLVLPKLITPGLAFIVWLLAVYIYVAYLHHYWENQVYTEDFADKFGMFLLNDLVYGFRKPLRLFPLLILLILLSWIAYATDDQHAGLGVFLVALLFGIMALWYFKDTINAKASNSEQKKMIDDNWSFLKKRIKGLITRQQWTDCNDFKDITEVWKISEEAIMYALARYALEFPEQAIFGMVYNRKTKQPVSGSFEHVLVSIQSLDDDKYFYV